MMKETESWDHYRTFLAVLEEGSLSGAARALGLTQPTVGRHMDALEAASGAPLFLRTPRGLLPTETALQMKRHAETMAATAAALARVASAAPGEVKGTVRISASEVMGVEVLPPILAELQESHPGLSVELSLSDAVEDLLRREADVAVRMTAPRQEMLLSRHVGAIPLGFYAHGHYLARHGTPASLKDLAGHRLIGFDRELAYVHALLREKPDFAALDFSFRTDSNLAQLAAIRAGIGIGMCQTGLARRDKDLVGLLAGALDLKLETFVVMHEDLKTTPRFRVTFDALVNGLLAYIAEK